jgi:hypothetical protein
MPTKRISFTEAEAAPSYRALRLILDNIKDYPEFDAYEIAALSRAATKINGAMERSAAETEREQS